MEPHAGIVIEAQIRNCRFCFWAARFSHRISARRVAGWQSVAQFHSSLCRCPGSRFSHSFWRLSRHLTAPSRIQVWRRIPAAVNGDATRLLRSPTVSARRSRSRTPRTSGSSTSGGIARRITSFQGQTSNPHFSPDGKWIAFSGEYAGNLDVYVVSAEGGEPKRLTWHPGADRSRAGRPTASRSCFRLRRATLGAERRAAILDRARCRRRRGADGAAARLPGKDFCRRRAHRLSHEQLVGRRAPQLSRRPEPADLDRRSENLRSGLAAVDRFEGHGSGLVGDTVYFISDRDGVANVWTFDAEGEEARARSRSSPTSM